MHYLLNLFTQKEIIIMGSVILILLVLVLILTVWDLLSRRKNEEEKVEVQLDSLDKVDKPLVEECKLEDKEVLEEVSEKEKQENVVEIEVLENDLAPVSKAQVADPLIMEIEEPISDVEILDNREKAKQELLRIEQELENPRSLEDTLTSLERIEEENAIISYQELLENTKELDVVEADSGDEPISLKEVFSMYEEAPIEELEVVSIENAYHGDFTSSPYLSPVEGVETETRSLAEIQLENTANLEKLEKEIRKTNEFLTILNELKKNLD